jgi:hypothetical protein
LCFLDSHQVNEFIELISFIELTNLCTIA